MMSIDEYVCKYNALSEGEDSLKTITTQLVTDLFEDFSEHVKKTVRSTADMLFVIKLFTVRGNVIIQQLKVNLLLKKDWFEEIYYIEINNHLDGGELTNDTLL